MSLHSYPESSTNTRGCGTTTTTHPNTTTTNGDDRTKEQFRYYSTIGEEEEEFPGDNQWLTEAFEDDQFWLPIDSNNNQIVPNQEKDSVPLIIQGPEESSTSSRRFNSWSPLAVRHSFMRRFSSSFDPTIGSRPPVRPPHTEETHHPVDYNNHPSYAPAPTTLTHGTATTTSAMGHSSNNHGTTTTSAHAISDFHHSVAAVVSPVGSSSTHTEGMIHTTITTTNSTSCIYPLVPPSLILRSSRPPTSFSATKVDHMAMSSPDSPIPVNYTNCHRRRHQLQQLHQQQQQQQQHGGADTNGSTTRQKRWRVQTRAVDVVQVVSSPTIDGDDQVDDGGDSSSTDGTAPPCSKRRKRRKKNNSNGTVRPLTPYNYYFRFERDRILRCIHLLEESSTTKSSNVDVVLSNKSDEEILGAIKEMPDYYEHYNWTLTNSMDFQQQMLQQQWSRDPTQKRKHCKSKQGRRLAFQILSTHIVTSWQALPQGTKDVFKAIAAQDRNRYDMEQQQLATTPQSQRSGSSME